MMGTTYPVQNRTTIYQSPVYSCSSDQFNVLHLDWCTPIVDLTLFTAHGQKDEYLYRQCSSIQSQVSFLCCHLFVSSCRANQSTAQSTGNGSINEQTAPESPLFIHHTSPVILGVFCFFIASPSANTQVRQPSLRLNKIRRKVYNKSFIIIILI